MLIVLALGLAVVAFLVAWVLLEVRRVHITLNDMPRRLELLERNIFTQLEALQALHDDLGLETSLPPTRGWAASPDFLRILAEHVRKARPRVIVECGSGASTIVLARCAQINGAGHVYSLDHQSVFAEQTRSRLADLGFDEWATVVPAPLTDHVIDGEIWPWYEHHGLLVEAIDMLIVDGSPEPAHEMARYPVGPILFPRLSENAAVFVDDAWTADGRKNVDRWLREFPDFQATSIPTDKGCVILSRKS